MARVAIPVADGVEDSEFSVPSERLLQAGHEIVVFGACKERAKGKRGTVTIKIERTADELVLDEFDALVIPGGWSPDKLRMDPGIVEFTRAMVEAGKPVAAICHGPQLLIEADVLRGRTLTSYPSVRRDVENAGAHWVDREVVVDGNLITSRNPDDLDAFCHQLLAHLEPPRVQHAGGIG